MAQIKQVGRVMVPVSDQDGAIEFYTGKLGFSVSADIPFGDGDRWVEVEPRSYVEIDELLRRVCSQEVIPRTHVAKRRIQ